MRLYPAMKIGVCLVAIMLALTGSAPAFSLRQIEGTWDRTSTWRGGGAKETRKATVVIRELADGGLSVTETPKGKTRVSTKERLFPNGTSRLVSYDGKGRVETTGKGKWRIRGSRMHYNYELTSKRAAADWVGTATRVNRNRFEVSATMGNSATSYRVRIKAVYIRRR